MNKPVLVVMAAGMGSRYGGLKQIDPVGGHGQLIIDYSIFDARRAGFETVVFIIKHEIEADFKAAELQAMSELLEKMGPDALTREKVSELRSDGNLVDGFKRAGDRARETVRRVKLMDTPAKKSADCLSELEKILPEMLDVLGPDELEKVRRNLVAVADKVEELIGEIDERA